MKNSTAPRVDMLEIHFVHSAATPHNNYLLDEIARMPGITLHRHFLFGPRSVPGRPWKQLGLGEVQPELVRGDVGTYFDTKLFRLAATDRHSVFFVIGWDYPLLVWLLMLLGLRRRPLIMWDDGPSPASLAAFKRDRWSPRQLVKRLLISLINRTDGAYFCTGRRALANVQEMGIRPEKLASLPFFVRAGAFDPALRDLHCCPPTEVLIIAGGRLVREKGYDVFIAALALLQETRPAGWRAVLIGSGQENDRLRALVAQHGLEGKLDFVGWTEEEQFSAYIHSGDIFVAPARFDHFPTTVIAALQAGVAVVATDAVGSAVEFIESESGGIIVPAGDARPLADALESLIADSDRRLRLAAAGRAVMHEWPVSRGARMIVDAARCAA